jgi:hypothetical protein
MGIGLIFDSRFSRSNFFRAVDIKIMLAAGSLRASDGDDVPSS